METQFADCCPRCGMKRKDILEKGIFGCGECFESFAWEARQVLLDVHGVSRYSGAASEALERKKASEVDLGEIFDREHGKKEENKVLSKESKTDSYAQRYMDTVEKMMKAAETGDFDTAEALKKKLEELKEEFGKKAAPSESVKGENDGNV